MLPSVSFLRNGQCPPLPFLSEKYPLHTSSQSSLSLEIVKIILVVEYLAQFLGSNSGLDWIDYLPKFEFGGAGKEA